MLGTTNVGVAFHPIRSVRPDYYTAWVDYSMRAAKLKDHEVYRTWVGLQDTESGRETGVRGFLKLSITVLGPGDRQKVHDLAEEIQVTVALTAVSCPWDDCSGGIVPLGQALALLRNSVQELPLPSPPVPRKMDRRYVLEPGSIK